jgi:Protein of unknown function (DUF433)
MIRHAPRHDRIATDPTVMLAKSVIRGTRITVEQILRELGAGMPIDEFGLPVHASARRTSTPPRLSPPIASPRRRSRWPTREASA